MINNNWDSYWDEEKNYDHWQRPAKSIIELAKDNDPELRPEVLDLGCGIGRHALALARAGFNVTAIDGAKHALAELEEQADKHNLNIRTIEGNYLKSLFEPERFDIIISYNVIYHGSREDFERAIELCKDYLKPDGLLFFTCPTRDDGKYGSGKKVAPHTYESLNSVHPGDIHYFADEKDITTFIEGLKPISIERKEHYWDNKGTEQFSSYWEVMVQK